jgi:3-deoxy-manno-octulosonate cytidylyltransferase (CMP-KDO synthetase)
MKNKIVAVIPAHLASVRFPRKILFLFHGLAMIEHVRRRALLAKHIDGVYVATCDDEIADTVAAAGGKVIRTASTHSNGTSRVAEAVAGMDCTHVILLQGDEPLLLPRHVERLTTAISSAPEVAAWNATGPITAPEELDRHSFVKCAIARDGRIMYCFRRSPSTAEFGQQRTYIRKILGIIAFRKDFLLKLAGMPQTTVERIEFIEQMRIIESGTAMMSVNIEESLPSVNEPHEAEAVLDCIGKNTEQRELLERILRQQSAAV